MHRAPKIQNAVTVVLLCSISSAGCGFAFTHAAPQGHQQLPYFSCTEGNAGPIIDIIWATLNVAAAVVVSTDPEAYVDANTTIAGGLLWGGFSTAAAIVGFNKTKSCREAKRLLAERQVNGGLPVATAPAPVAAPVVEANARPLASTSSPSHSLAAQQIQSVVVEPAKDSLLVGQRKQLVASAHFSSGVTAALAVFRWSSSNDAVASVSNAGLVTAHAAGEVVVAANTDNVVGTATIVVRSR
jgi:uncharacterized protein YjdB